MDVKGREPWTMLVHHRYQPILFTPVVSIHSSIMVIQHH